MKPRTAIGGACVPDDARRVLMDSIRQLALASHFHRATLKTAERLAGQRHAWRKPLAWFQPDAGRADALQGEVALEDGVFCATVYLYSLLGQQALDTSCTCGHARCAHAAALLVRLQQLLDWPRAMTALERWQSGLHEPPDAPATPSPPWSFACLLQPGPPGKGRPPNLLAQPIAYHQQDADGRPLHWSAAEKARPHLSPSSHAWLARLLASQRQRASNASHYVLEGENGAHLLDELLRAGICRHAGTLQRLRPGAQRHATWRWRHDDMGCAVVELQLPGDVHVLDLHGLRYLDETTGELGALDLSRAAWDMLICMPPIPPGEAARLIEQWPPHPCLGGVPAPPSPPPIRDVDSAMRYVLVLGATWDAAAGEHWFHVRPWADYAGCRWPLAKDVYKNPVVVRGRDGYLRLHRSAGQETLAHRALLDAGFQPFGSLAGSEACRPAPPAGSLAHPLHHRGRHETFSALDAELQRLCDGDGVLEYDPELPFAVLARRPGLRATLDKGQHPGTTLFELAADVDGETIDMLPIIMQGLVRHAFALAPQPGEPKDAYWLAPLGARRLVPLPLAQLREWLNPLVDLLDHPACAGNKLELSRAQAMALADCLERQGIPVAGARAADMAGTLASLRQALAASEPVAAPTAFRGTLRHYQQQGLRWLQALRCYGLGGVLADDMGLGKTVQVIAHLLLEQEAGRLRQPALIVAPTSLVFNWIDEIGRFAPSLRCLNLTGPGRAARFERIAGAEVVVTSYALLPVDLPVLDALEYAMLVLDEAQWIKNPATQAARAARRLRAQHRVAVTGTPLENHLGELWAHFDAVLPGYLGDARAFQRGFRTPIERQDDDQRRQVLRQRIAPFLLRRDKQSVAPELPPKIDTVLRIAMGEPQRRLYETLRLAQSERVREALASYGNEQARIVVLSALLRLRQACCHPQLVPSDHGVTSSAKLEALLQLVPSLREEGRRILVFSQFTAMLALIARAFDEAGLPYAMLTGDSKDRAAPVRDFQGGAVPILLASLKAGGVGLNLTAADAIVHYDPWWNPAVERQAVDRAHRIGRDAPVLVFKLLCEDTIEEKIESMKDHKGDLADAVLGGIDDTRPLDALDVRKLFDLPDDSPLPFSQRKPRHAH